MDRPAGGARQELGKQPAAYRYPGLQPRHGGVADAGEKQKGGVNRSALTGSSTDSRLDCPADRSWALVLRNKAATWAADFVDETVLIYALAGLSPPFAIPGRPGSGLRTCCTPSSFEGSLIGGNSFPSTSSLISLASSTSRSSRASAIFVSTSRFSDSTPLAFVYPSSTSRRT